MSRLCILGSSLEVRGYELKKMGQEILRWDVRSRGMARILRCDDVRLRDVHNALTIGMIRMMFIHKKSRFLKGQQATHGALCPRMALHSPQRSCAPACSRKPFLECVTADLASR